MRLAQLPGPAARVAHGVRAVQVTLPTMMVVLDGEKQIAGARVRAGQLVMIDGPTRLDVENRPGRSGWYRAFVHGFAAEAVADARRLWARTEPPVVRSAGVSVSSAAPLGDALDGFVSARLSSGALSAWAEVHLLLTLALSGHTGFLAPTRRTLTSRVRELIGGEPGRRWTSALVEARLGVSGATLRRRLAREGGSLRGLLEDVRLHHGLALAQTTDAPLKAIAPACGYRSVVAFKRRFLARFGAGAAPLLLR